MVKMWLIVMFVGFSLQNTVLGLWDKDIKCPRLCTCRLEHITETAIHRFIQKDNENDRQPVPEAVILESNDVFYEDDFNNFDESSFIRSATCIVQTETETEELINELPREIQSISLIQASDSGNKSIKFGYFNKFPELKIIELQSAQKLKKDTTSHFICEVDIPLEQLEYLNLERVLLKNSKKRQQLLEIEANEEVVTFEYVQKTEGSSHPLTFVRRGTNDKILPYKTYIENQINDEFPLFTGFSSLILLRIYECDLNNIHWEMFENLNNLNNLILENNKLRFIPDFAFYGTPNLKSLSLAWNNLLNIQITDLAGLLELEYLDLSHNNFSQLSELSLPPFPKLKLANFANNPITVVFPNTFEVMNTTDSLILGGLDEPLTLLTNSFLGLKLLKTLTLLHLNIPVLKREILIGLPSLRVLGMTGNIPEIQYDAFLEVINLETLLLSKCNVTQVSMDAFIGLDNLRLLDLSKNNLEFIPPGTFDDLKNLKELYLNNNRFKNLPKDLFSRTYARLIRLNENPWHCSCEMSDWKPLLINRIKQKSIKPCDSRQDKGVGCTFENTIYYKYVYENRVAPKCATPKRYENWSVFHVMRKQFKCPEFKPKLKKKISKFPRNNTRSDYNITQKTRSKQLTYESRSDEASTETDENKTNESIDHPMKHEKLLRKLSLQLKINKTLISSSLDKSDQDQVPANNADENTSTENYSTESFKKLMDIWDTLSQKHVITNHTLDSANTFSGNDLNSIPQYNNEKITLMLPENQDNNLVPANMEIAPINNKKPVKKAKKHKNKVAKLVLPKH